jgi:hypothetical protein
MKNYPYWARGGIVSVVLSAVVALILFIFFTCSTPFTDSCWFPSWAVIFYLPLVIFQINLPVYPASFADTAFLIKIILAAIIFYFIIGAIIGWIYGKIKNRNKTEAI